MKHFYHLYCGKDSAWLEPAAEHFAELRRSELPVDITVSIVGPAERREGVREWLKRTQNPGVNVTEADSGYEEVTLNQVLSWARDADPDTPVLYAHTKGSWHSDIVQTWWRRTMTEHLVTHWEQRLYDLRFRDIVTWSWLEPGDYGLAGNGDRKLISSPIPGGNFWWARAGYIAKLEPLVALTTETRYDAETWVGRQKPVVGASVFTWPAVTNIPWPPQSGELTLEQMEQELGLR
jgi:hypothetical protein